MENKFVLNSQGHLARPEQADVILKVGDRVKLQLHSKPDNKPTFGTITEVLDRTDSFGAPYKVKTDMGWEAKFMYCQIDLTDVGPPVEFEPSGLRLWF